MANKFKGNTLPIDQDVQVPEAVRRAAAAADAAMAANNPTPAAPPAPPVANNDQITIAPPPEPQRLPNQVPLTIEPAPPPPQEPPAPQPQQLPQPAPNAENGSWEQKYNSILGRFKDATTQLQHSNSRIEALENMLASIQSAPRAPEPAPQPKQLITDKDKEDFGEDMLSVMRRVAQEVVQPYEGINSELENLRRNITGVTQQTTMTARERMLDQLTQAVPNWQAINHDPDFHAWLALQDPYAGVIRHKLLTEAYGRNDAARVLNFFKGFISDTAALSPAASTTVQPPAQQPGRPTLEDLAAPGRARTAASPQAPAEKQPIRTSDIAAFYNAVRKGAYKGREQEQAALEAELHAAMREGRIITDT